MILTEKEANAIEDLKTQEQACIEKYTQQPGREERRQCVIRKK